MQKHNLGVIFYGYHGMSNRVLNHTPNPAVIVKIDQDHNQTFIRVPDDAVVGIDVRLNHQRFDEKFNVLEFNEYLKRCKQFKLVPFDGFYFEVEDSWKSFGYTKEKPLPKIMDRKLVEQDQKYVADNREKLTLVMSTNANELLDYMSDYKEKNNE